MGEEHGLGVFIASLVCFAIFTQYLRMIPKFALPFNVRCRSKWGYAYSGELAELKKIKLPKFPYLYSMMVESEYSGVRKDKKVIWIENERDFWNESYPTNKELSEMKVLSAAMFAKSKGYSDVLEWLEEQGAGIHSDWTQQKAITLIEERTI